MSMIMHLDFPKSNICLLFVYIFYSAVCLHFFWFFSDIEFAVDETEEVGETIYNKIGINILWNCKKKLKYSG